MDSDFDDKFEVNVRRGLKNRHKRPRKNGAFFWVELPRTGFASSDYSK